MAAEEELVVVDEVDLLLGAAAVVAVVDAIVAAVAECVGALAFDVVDDERLNIAWILWQPPKVSMSAAAHTRTEKRIVTPIGLMGAPTHRRAAWKPMRPSAGSPLSGI